FGGIGNDTIEGGTGNEALTMDALGGMALANAAVTAGNGASTSNAVLTAQGAVTLASLTADNAVSIGAAAGRTAPTSLTAGSIRAISGPISGTAGAIDVASSAAGGSIAYDAGTT
ncbi:MAG TPA: hypothetical protein PKE25_11050, partial [Novosphingobium sp.]|nr:hypothetical protein [Novosphingobium sp.]